MKKCSKFLWMLCVTALVALLCGCSAADFTLPAEMDMQPGDIRVLAELVQYSGEEITQQDAEKLLMLADGVENIEFSMVSTAPSVVSVDSEGVMMAGDPGEATIIVSCAALDYYAEVQVKVTEMPVSLATEPEALLEIGNTYTLTTTVQPATASAQLRFASSDERVAAVDENGTVTAVGAGHCTATASVAGSSLAAACEVTVIGGETVQNIALSRAESTLNPGQMLLLRAKTWPQTNQTIAWQSSDERVATVDAEGMVTAVGGGIAEITATADGKTAACTLTVPAPATPESATPESATPESATPESATPESATGDMEELSMDVFWGDATPESATPESATPESATPESATPESATPESATPESATPENATPESATPESATPESATPESATPESATPESATPESAMPEETPLQGFTDWLGNLGQDIGQGINDLFGKIFSRSNQ